MNKRFKKYLGLRQITQKEMASLSGLSEMQISRFCNNNIITVNALLKLLSACDDLSLDFLFFGYGSILKTKNSDVTYNYGNIQNNHSEDISNNSIFTEDSSQKQKLDFLQILHEKEKLLAEKDRIISERDATISRLLTSLPPSSTNQ